MGALLTKAQWRCTTTAFGEQFVNLELVGASRKPMLSVNSWVTLLRLRLGIMRTLAEELGQFS